MENNDGSKPVLELSCPITLNKIKVPLVTKCAHTFERQALLNWLQHSNNCPVCRTELNIIDYLDHSNRNTYLESSSSSSSESSTPRAQERISYSSSESSDSDDSDSDDSDNVDWTTVYEKFMRRKN